MSVLHDLLRPPDGYKLEQLVVTTYTLDLLSLLSVPLAFSSWGHAEDTDAIVRDPLELLAALQRVSERMTVFYQGGAIAVPGRHRHLLPLLEESLVAVPEPRPGGVFHPKTWIASYEDDHGDRRYSFLCLSRNLTGDRCWDTVLSLDGKRGRGRTSRTKPLADFVRWLARLAPRKSERADALLRLSTALGAVRFEVPEPFHDLAFQPMGIRGYRADPIGSSRRDRVLVVSPFVGSTQLQRLCAGATDAVLVGRPEELGKLRDGLPQSVNRLLCLNDALEAEPEEEREAPAWLAGLHAKFYAADQGWGATVWTGSANATEAAFTRNVEFLVELSGKKSRCGVDALLGDGSRDTFASMLVDCGEQLPEPEDDSLDRELDAIARSVAELPLEVRATEGEKGWTLELASRGPVHVNADARIDVSPLARAQKTQQLRASHLVLARFEGLAAHEVSGLFVVDVRLEGHRGALRSFVAAWPLVGDVPDRVRSLLRELARDPDRMIAFIRMFLGAGDESPVPTANGEELGGAGEDWVIQGSETGLLELLVRTLAREPRRIDELADWIPDLAEAAGDGAGAELLKIWQPVWEARQQLKDMTSP